MEFRIKHWFVGGNSLFLSHGLVLISNTNTTPKTENII